MPVAAGSGQALCIDAFAYKRWAMQRTLAAVHAVDAQAFPASVAFARQQLNHIALVEALFRARLLDAPAPHAATNSAEVPALAVLAERLVDSDRWYAGYLAALTTAQWDAPVRFRFADGRDGCMTRGEILFHILNHATYHRGAIGHALDLAGVAHPADTYTVFVHETQPQRRGGVLPA
ncbi:DinB family protein [Stenotrophomonas mori]|uniref:DinB family protein n=1 Tax=Stenotrophomonas mori TaxID=2871096 RepID=A0ABT0SHI2_9GAMM|nr:DinB family protein [Stenotrophomonas mori]MCL7714561.1 DinB family protein [Stenotrophomonas mori]